MPPALLPPLRMLLPPMAALVLALAASTARAQSAVVFHSPGDDGVPGVAASLDGGKPVDLFLYVDGGSAVSDPGAVCQSGTGSELCGWDVRIDGKAATLESFTPDASADVVFHLSSDRLRANGLSSFGPVAGPVRLGVLRVSASAGPGTVEVAGRQAAGAALQVVAVEPAVLAIAVPEPGAGLPAAASLAALALLRVLAAARRPRGAAPALASAIGGLLMLPTAVRAAPLILNEYNAVASGKFLNGGSESEDGNGNTTDPASDTYFGRVAGNGGDWFELVATADGLDIRGWQLEIREGGALDETLVLSQDLLWSDLAAGTIITIAEDEPEDASYDPSSGDFWIHVQAADGASGTYVTASNFPVSSDDWLLTIRDAAGAVVFGPVGEGLAPDPATGFEPVGINDTEVFKLEASPSAVIAPSSPFYDDGGASSFGSENRWGTGQSLQDLSALRLQLPGPDRDGDGVPDDGDRSGVVGDAPCDADTLAGCDDNCPVEPNPLQTDDWGLDGDPDGTGNACQCGDVDGDGQLTRADLADLRTRLSNPAFQLAAPQLCGVVNDGRCDVNDAVLMDRVTTGAELRPAPAPVCRAAAVPRDPTQVYFNPNRLVQVDIDMDPVEFAILRDEGYGGAECASGDFREMLCRFLALLTAPGCGDGPFPSPYTWYSATGTVDGETIEQVGIRKKGFVGSVNSAKPSLKLRFDRLVAGRHLNGLQRMTFNNGNQDPAIIRACIAYEFYRDAGVPAPRCNFAQVRVNGESLGVYQSVDSIRPAFLERNFGSDAGKLYEGQSADFVEGKFRNTFEPKSDEAAADTSEIDALIPALLIEDPGERLAAIEALVDVDAFLTFWAAEGIAGQWDAYVANANNFFVYVRPSDDRLQFIPWGADAVLGIPDILGGGGFELPPVTPRSALARALYAVPETRDRLIDRMRFLIDAVWAPEDYVREASRIEALVAEASGDISGPVSALKAWISGRRDQVEAAIADGPPVIDTSLGLSHFCDFLSAPPVGARALAEPQPDRDAPGGPR